MADTWDLKSLEAQASCGFESRRWHPSFRARFLPVQMAVPGRKERYTTAPGQPFQRLSPLWPLGSIYNAGEALMDGKMGRDSFAGEPQRFPVFPVQKAMANATMARRTRSVTQLQSR